MKAKVCEICKQEYMPTRANQKYCKSCKPLAQKMYEKNRIHRKKPRKYKPKGNDLDTLAMEAKQKGISYGKLQALRYMEGMSVGK